MKTFQDYLVDCGGHLDVRSYSGRFMYGKICVGIVGQRSKIMSVLSDMVLHMCEDMLEFGESPDTSNECYEVRDMIASLFNYSQDDMGLDIIIYWPEVEYIETSDNDC